MKVYVCVYIYKNELAGKAEKNKPSFRHLFNCKLGIKISNVYIFINSYCKQFKEICEPLPFANGKLYLGNILIL